LSDPVSESLKGQGQIYKLLLLRREGKSIHEAK
jgi:hypothetical protein